MRASKARHLEILAPKKTTTSVTKTKEVKASDHLQLIFGTMAITIEMIIWPVCLVISPEYIGETIISTGIIFGLFGSIRFFEKKGTRYYSSQLTGEVSWIRPKDVKNAPNSRKLLHSTPVAVKQYANIADIVFNHDHIVPESEATHTVEEYAVWQDGRLYSEQVTKETPYGIWQFAFHALMKKESHLTTVHSQLQGNKKKALEKVGM